MNKALYWKIRKKLLNLLFRYKVFIYKGISLIGTSKRSISYSIIIIKKVIWGLIRGIIIATILLYIDKLIPDVKSFTEQIETSFLDIVICCLGMSGVILGLYCANISSIYSSKYSNAPEPVLDLFQHDKLTQRCIDTIMNYIIFDFIVIIELLIGSSISWGTVLTTVLGAIVVIISFTIAANRAYQLANIYHVADDSFQRLYRIITKDLLRSFYSDDANFQHHFQKVSEHLITQLGEIQRFGETVTENNSAPMVQFMCKNIIFVEKYWKIKNSIDRKSYWFRNKGTYQKWHLAQNGESSIALQAGTNLIAKIENDYWWFEDELFSINRECLLYLCKHSDYLSIYTYLSEFDTLCKIAIRSKEVSYFVEQINYLIDIIKKFSTIKSQDQKEEATYSSIVEMISLLYINIILEATQYYSELDIETIISDTIDALDTGKAIVKSPLLRGNKQKDFYDKIITEIKVEGKRITPNWIIAQNIAKEFYSYMNVLEDVVKESIDSIYNLGKYFIEKDMLFEACILIVKSYQYNSKVSRFIATMRQRGEELSRFHVDKEMPWDESRLNILEQSIEKWKLEMPPLLSDCSVKFALETWEMRDNYPDFLGECYNHICEDAIESIVQDNLTQFQVDFENLSKLMLLYQEYIRTDFVKNKDLYRAGFAYYTFTSPIVEWAQIGGLSILWGEFNSHPGWKNIVKKNSAEALGDSPRGIETAEKIIEIIQTRATLRSWNYERDMLESMWQQRVSQAMRASPKYQIEYDGYSPQLKTESKLLKAFLNAFDIMSFTTDPAEVFWVLCVNPILPDEKKFHASFSWEDTTDDQSIHHKKGS